MVRNADDIKDIEHVSFSFIPSLKCNNHCSFCMYRASPESTIELDYNAAARWVETVNWNKVIGWGFYGGEPSIEIPLYDKFVRLIPGSVRKFVITNGTWSTDCDRTKEFLDWCAKSCFHIIISGTPEHRAKQHVKFIENLVNEFKDAITYKPEQEEMHPMGRLARKNWRCSRKCIWHEQVTRLGIFPTGDIILQNCDGVYPVFGTIYRHNFDEAFAWGKHIRKYGCEKDCENINDLLTLL